MRRLQTTPQMKEGEIICKWYASRFGNNKNALVCLTGSTGSGKSYTCLRIAELWYDYKFGEPFPVKTHCCFSISEIMTLLNSGTLRKGELIILEEAGVLLHSLDFQNRISKLFTFILQSFRSMNIGLLFNLPILSMLNKNTRLLLHAHFITNSIDFRDETIKIKPFFNQVNQQTGKIYPKYLWISSKGKSKQVKRFKFNLPSKDILKIYEAKKHNFVSELNQKFVDELVKKELEEKQKMSRDVLTEKQREVYNDLVVDELSVKESAEKRERGERTTYHIVELIRKKGFECKIKNNYKKKANTGCQTPSPLLFNSN